MTINRYGGDLTAECDDCGDTLSASELGMDDPESFEEFKDALKEDGWIIKRVGDSWAHTCPDCV